LRHLHQIGVAAAHHIAQPAHPTHALVAPVPDQAERAARPQHSRDLGERARRIDPVPRLRDGDGIHAGVVQRDALGGAGEGADVGQLLLENLAHLAERLHGDHLQAAADQRAGELAGARAQVEHRAHA
jgi:hypothetical protein